MKLPRMFINRIFNKAGPPIHLVWFITAECDLRCSHCFYFTQARTKKEEFSLEEISKTVDNLPPLLSISLTGGEPFLRKDLLEITKLLYKRKLAENILLFTNGFNTENILSTAEKILSACSDVNIHIGVSIDGYETEHDKYRNKKGSYNRAIETLKKLKKLNSYFPNLTVGISITLHSGNQNIIQGLREDIYSKFAIWPGVTMIRGDVKIPMLKDVNPKIYQEIVKTFEYGKSGSKPKKIYQTIIDTRVMLGQKLAYKTFINHSRSYNCYAGSLMGIIYDNGDVYPCEMLKNSKIGNLRSVNYDLNKIWRSPRANETRKWIKRRKCFCTYECQYTSNTLYNFRFLPIFIINILKRVFAK